MSRIVISHLRFKPLILIVMLIGILSATEIEAGKYRQPAYVTNAYFTNRITNNEGRIKPDTIINVIRAGHENTHGNMVLDLLADRGTHHFSIELLDSTGKMFEKHDFPPAAANKDNFVISLNLKYGGDLPDNGIFFKLHDQFNRKGKMIIGTFRILSDQWQ